MTVLRELEDFLLKLQDDYGFLIPADRLKQCLSCFGDITDMEEVFYRVQSLVCKNEEQIDMFRPLFAQRFLNITPTKPLKPAALLRSGSQMPKSTAALSETEKGILENKLHELKADIEKNEQEIQEIAKSKQEFAVYARELSEKVSELDLEAQTLKDEKARLLEQYNSVQQSGILGIL